MCITLIFIFSTEKWNLYNSQKTYVRNSQKKIKNYFDVTAVSSLRYSSSFTNSTFHKQEFCS